MTPCLKRLCRPGLRGCLSSGAEDRFQKRDICFLKGYPMVKVHGTVAQSPKGRLVHGFYNPIHGDCAIYFYPGVKKRKSVHLPGSCSFLRGRMYSLSTVTVCRQDLIYIIYRR